MDAFLIHSTYRGIDVIDADSRSVSKCLNIVPKSAGAAAFDHPRYLTEMTGTAVTYCRLNDWS